MRRVLIDPGMLVITLLMAFWKTLDFFLHPFRIYRDYILKNRPIPIALAKNESTDSKSPKKRLSDKLLWAFDRIFSPVHGVSENNMQEWFTFRRKSWENLFLSHGWIIKKHFRNICCSPYGLMKEDLPLKHRRKFGEFGLSSCDTWILEPVTP